MRLKQIVVLYSRKGGTILANTPFSFLTVTWAADLAHFTLLRESLKRSSLSHVPHHVVVQDEDLPLFRQFEQVGVYLYSSADILPKEVELRRRSALKWQRIFGRRGATVGGSVSRYLSLPQWVRYTGWHTQQISKLSFLLSSQDETVVVLDSDVIVTQHASEDDFVCSNKVICYEHWRDSTHLSGKVKNWQKTAFSLFNKPFTVTSFDAYYDTPFVMHSPSVRQLAQWLEDHYGQPWWQVLAGLPPRRWSEFGIYKQFLREKAPYPVDWREPHLFGHIFGASSEDVLTRQLRRAISEDEAQFVTLHSQNSGRRRWSVDSYTQVILEHLPAGD